MTVPPLPPLDDSAERPEVPRGEAGPHTAVEDVLAIVTGTFIASLGLFLLKSAAAVTGGTAGLSLLLSIASGWQFSLLFVLVNVPFFVLALRVKGWRFTVRTIICVLAVSGFSELHPLALGVIHPEPVYAVLGGNLLIGVGLLVLFRHGASLGGFNIAALILQEKLNWRAGYVQMALDVTVILLALTVVPPLNVALSALGAVVLNIVLALNHRPGRYLGA